MIATSDSTPRLADFHRCIYDELRRTEAIFDAELHSDLAVVNDFSRQAALYRGKMLRPSLLLLMARAVGKMTTHHPTLAAVVEMVHVATLVHDDVLDEADERRGQPTIKALSGHTAAVLLGDYLISHAYHLCSSIGDVHAARRIGAATNTVCEGELLQNHHRGDPELSEEVYLDIIGRKTGALTAVACELGVDYAGGERAQVTAAYDYGMAVGVAFQIIDDLLDIIGETRQVGKTLHIDLMLGKLTLPTLHGLRAADSATKLAVREVVTGQRTCAPQQLRAWLERTGSIEYAMIRAREYIRIALETLDGFAPSEARTTLAALAEFVVQRQF